MYIKMAENNVGHRTGVKNQTWIVVEKNEHIGSKLLENSAPKMNLA